ncbi:MAG: pyruvate kinase [Chlorobi bacterium]|nr:pyruvate kinase [Chlorobiota bacterium]
MIGRLKQTKIVATISDKNCDVKFLKKLYENGMNVVRLNTAHQTFEDTFKVINNVRKVSDKIALLLDTKGPEIRTTKATEEFPVKAGDIVNIQGNPNKETNKQMIYVSYKNFVKDIPVNSRILIDDGVLELLVLEKENDTLKCEVQNTGIIQGKKSVNIPSAHIKLPSLSKKDIDYLHFAVDNNLDFIAHSFVRKKEDVQAVKKILDEKKNKIKIIAKIENQDGVDNIDEILNYADGIMVARGDLAIEIPRERIPHVQKIIIKKCIEKRKPVITATQMLHTMIRNPRPTRAEVSDVANAIYDGTDAIMLSGETAYGKYPVESVQMMNKIALEVEKTKEDFNEIPAVVLNNEISAYLCKSAVKASVRLSAEAIIADSISGRTIRNLSAFRGKKPIYAVCYNKTIMRELALTYGAHAHYLEPRKKTSEFIAAELNYLLKNKSLHKSDIVVIVAGNFGPSMGASFIEISTVEKILQEQLAFQKE